MTQEIEYVQFPITKVELLALSMYLMDKDDIEGCGIDEVVDRIHSRANSYEKELCNNGRRI